MTTNSLQIFSEAKPEELLKISSETKGLVFFPNEKSTHFVFKGTSQLFHTLCMQLSLLLAEPSPWFKLSCNKLASEMCPDLLSLGPVIYSRNACNDIGN